MKSDPIFDVLIRQYPSGMYVNSLLAARNFSLRQDQILVGNGAAELIKALIGHTTGKLGVIRPTFEEYANRYESDKVVPYYPDNDNFSYTADDLINFFEDKDISCLTVVNPDNPSGKLHSQRGYAAANPMDGERNIHMIADESLLTLQMRKMPPFYRKSFSDEYPHLTVIKSISKSYGIPGLRLGIAASGNKDRICLLKKR